MVMPCVARSVEPQHSCAVRRPGTPVWAAAPVLCVRLPSTLRRVEHAPPPLARLERSTRSRSPRGCRCRPRKHRMEAQGIHACRPSSGDVSQTGNRVASWRPSLIDDVSHPKREMWPTIMLAAVEPPKRTADFGLYVGEVATAIAVPGHPGWYSEYKRREFGGPGKSCDAIGAEDPTGPRTTGLITPDLPFAVGRYPTPRSRPDGDSYPCRAPPTWPPHDSRPRTLTAAQTSSNALPASTGTVRGGTARSAVASRARSAQFKA